MTISAKAKPDTAAPFPKAGVSSMIDYLVALLQRPVADWQSKDTTVRIRTATCSRCDATSRPTRRPA
ncbi:hypothetical protein ACFCYC_12100 [Streptomyces sp. NPDC056402]|uniref:hypothetical protein n=1 Tax=Streptomyces sp. NPDC056402 TaxID=3345810 RepID=UPI0035E36994